MYLVIVNFIGCVSSAELTEKAIFKSCTMQSPSAWVEVISDAAAHPILQFKSGHTPIIIVWRRRRVVLTFKCCCKSLRVGTTISCGTEFFRVVFAFGTVPVGRLFAPGDILDASLQSISSLVRCVYLFCNLFWFVCSIGRKFPNCNLYEFKTSRIVRERDVVFSYGRRHQNNFGQCKIESRNLLNRKEQGKNTAAYSAVTTNHQRWDQMNVQLRFCETNKSHWIFA